MSPPSAPPRSRARRAARVALALAAALTVLYLLREPLLGGLLGRIAADRLSAGLGAPVRIARVGGSWFGGVVVHGLAGEGLAGGAVSTVTCDRLAIDWRLADLVRGQGLAAITAIRAEGLAIALDPAAAPAGDGGGGGFDLGRLPEPLPALDIAARATVATARGPVRLGAIRLLSDGRTAQLAVAGIELPVVGAVDAFALSVVRTGDRLRIGGVDPIAGIVPRRIDLALGGGGARVEAELGLLGGTLAVVAGGTEARVDSAGLELGAVPPWLARVLGRFAPSAGRLELALRASRAGSWSVAGALAAQAVMIDGRTLDRLRVAGRAGADGVRIDAADAHASGLDVVAHGLVWSGRPWPERGRLEATSADLRPLLALALPSLAVPPGPVALRVALAAGDGALRGEGVELSADGWRLTGDGALAADGTVAADLRLAVDRLTALAWCLPVGPGTAGRGDLRVAYRGPLALRPDGLPAGRATLAVDGEDIVLARRMLGEVVITADLTDGRGAIDLASRGERGAFGLAATGWRDGGDLALRVQRAGGSWRGLPWAVAAPTDLRVGAGGVRLSPTTVAVGPGRLAIAAELGARWQASAELDRLPIGTVAALLGLQAASGTLTGALAVSGPAERPHATIALDLADGLVAGRPARLALAARQDDEGLRITTGEAAWGDLVEVRASGSWPVVVGRDGALGTGGVPDLRVHLAVPDLARLLPDSRLVGGFTATASAETVAGGPRGRLTAIGRGLRIRPVDPDEPEVAPLDLALDANADPEGATLTVLLRDRSTEVLAATLASRAPLAPQALLDPAAWRERPVGGELVLDGLPLGPLQPLAPALLGLAGRVSGTLAIAGTGGDPRMDGTLTLAGAEFKLRSDLPRFTGGTGTLALAGQVLTVALDGELGYAPVACRGRATLDGRGVPALDLRLTGSNALLAQDRDLRLRAALDVRLAGPLDELTASGRIEVTDALWSRRIDLIRASTPGADNRLQFFAIRGGPFAGMRLDLRIVADRTLRLVNNLITADCSLDLHLGGTGAVPVPEGRLWTTGARLSLPFSSLTIDRAQVRFTAENPFRPELEASGHTRMQGYELTAVARGPIDDVEVEVTSTPPLPPEDALLLLTTGATRTGLAAAGERGALTRVGTYLGQELLRKAAGPGNPDEEGLLDKVTLAIGEQTSRSGVDTILAEVVLVPERRPPPRPRDGLRVGELVLVGERDRYDAYNIGLIYRLRFK